MIKKAAMTIIFALLWSFFIGESSNVLANYDSDSMWSLLPVNCEQEFECQTRLSLEGDLLRVGHKSEEFENGFYFAQRSVIQEIE